MTGEFEIMKRFMIALLCAAFTASLLAAPAQKQKGAKAKAKQEKIQWYADVESAQKELKGEKKSILVFFTAPAWCGPCRNLEKGPISSSKFAAVVKKNIAVKFDFSNRGNVPEPAKAALKKYNVSGFPTLLVLDAEALRLYTTSEPPLITRYVVRGVSLPPTSTIQT